MGFGAKKASIFFSAQSHRWQPDLYALPRPTRLVCSQDVGHLDTGSISHQYLQLCCASIIIAKTKPVEQYPLYYFVFIPCEVRFLSSFLLRGKGWRELWSFSLILLCWCEPYALENPLCSRCCDENVLSLTLRCCLIVGEEFRVVEISGS